MGNLDSHTFIDRISSAYRDVVHWQRNLFSVPFGSVGKAFVSELARLFTECAEGTALESIAFKAAIVCCVLLLRRPHGRSKAHDHVKCLERRMTLWKDGSVDELMFEGKSIQQCLTRYSGRHSPTNLMNSSRVFANLMFRGKVREAIKLLTAEEHHTVLHVGDSIQSSDDCTVLDILMQKHPQRQPIARDSLVGVGEDPPFVHPVIYEKIDSDSVRRAACAVHFWCCWPIGY
jgi:hypothetical protein